jgi:hypothetical protein
MPELKHLPSEEREEIVEAAVFSLPITLRRLHAPMQSKTPKPIQASHPDQAQGAAHLLFTIIVSAVGRLSKSPDYLAS